MPVSAMRPHECPALSGSERKLFNGAGTKQIHLALHQTDRVRILRLLRQVLFDASSRHCNVIVTGTGQRVGTVTAVNLRLHAKKPQHRLRQVSGFKGVSF